MCNKPAVYIPRAITASYLGHEYTLGNTKGLLLGGTELGAEDTAGADDAAKSV